MNRVCEILGIQKPVIQAPMAWITSSDLVAAVSNAGGLGVLGTSRLGGDQAWIGGNCGGYAPCSP
ncbi:MAG: nitronate monooxygenase [Ruminococcus sp.]|nr:nitronate monooxygenase [Ruminococcus sp.]